MKRALLLIFAISLCSVTYAYSAPKVSYGNNQPTTCNPANGDFWIDTNGTAGNRLYICTGTNTYTINDGLASTKAPALGADDNYVTDSEKIKLSNLTGTNTGDQTTVSGNAGTATALAANGGNCSAGQAALGVDASGAAEGCWTPSAGSMTWPAAAGIMVYGGSSAFGTSLVADGDSIGEVIVVHDDGSGNPALPFTLDLMDLTSGATAISPPGTSGLSLTADTSGVITWASKQAADDDLTTWAGITPGTGVGTALALAVNTTGGVLTTAALTDTPANGGMTTGPTANWAYDHAALAMSDTVVGHVEAATTAETTAGTSGTLAVTPDGLSGSVYGQKEIGWAVINSDTVTAVADGKQAAVIPASMNGMNLVDVTCSVHDLNNAASGATTVVLRRVRGATAVDMTSTGVTIDYNAYTASDETVDTSNDDVATGDKLYIDVNAVTTAVQKGLSCTALFNTP